MISVVSAGPSVLGEGEFNDRILVLIATLDAILANYFGRPLTTRRGTSG
jgi:hypothetical protein